MSVSSASPCASAAKWTKPESLSPSPLATCDTFTQEPMPQAALTADNVASVPLCMATHDDRTMIHVSRNRNDLLTVTNDHPMISKCFASLVLHTTLQRRAENMGMLEPEPFLHPSNDRFVTCPIHHHDLARSGAGKDFSRNVS